MNKHTKLYRDVLADHTEMAEYLPCEICFQPMTDVHHIKARGMGGSGSKDTILNLMGLCRHCHVEYGDKKMYMDFLISEHYEYLQSLGLEIENFK